MIVEVPARRSPAREPRRVLADRRRRRSSPAAASGAARRPPTGSRGAAPPSAATGAEAVELTVFGAASLKGALEEAKAAYEAANPGTTLTLSTDSSAALETQIEQGAPADVFLSADTTNPQKLVDGGSRRRRRRRLRRQRADVIAPDRQPGRPDDAARPRQGRRPGHRGRRRGADHEVRDAARRQPRRAGRLPRRTSPRPTPRTSSPRRTTSPRSRTKIELGEGDAAIVYVTDAAASDKVATIEVPDDANVPATLRRASSSRPRRTPRRRRPSSTGSPAPTARRSSPTSGSCRPRHDRASPASRRAGRGRRTPTRRGADSRWGRSRPCALAAPLRAVPRRCRRRPHRAVARSTASLLAVAGSAGGPRGARPQPRHDRRQPRAHGRRSGCRSRSSSRAGRSAASGSSRRSSTCRSSCRRRSPGWRCCSCSAGAGCSAGPLAGRRHRHRVHDGRGDPRPDVRVGAVLRPRRARRASPAWTATSRTPPASTAPRSASCSGGSPCRSPAAALAAGLVMSWARALGEFGATIMFAGNVEGRTQTLPLVVYAEFQARRPRRLDRRRGDPRPGRARRARRRPGLPLGPRPRPAAWAEAGDASARRGPSRTVQSGVPPLVESRSRAPAGGSAR